MMHLCLPYSGSQVRFKRGLLSLLLMVSTGYFGIASTLLTHQGDLLNYEEYASVHPGETYFAYLENKLFGFGEPEEIIVTQVDVLATMAANFASPVVADTCPDVPYEICDDYGILVGRGYLTEGMIDKEIGSRPFCLIDGRECFNLEGLNLHGQKESDVFFDVYNYQHDPNDPEAGCEFNFYFTEHTDTKHVKAFIIRCSYTETGIPQFECFGDTETMTSIPITCDDAGNPLPEFWTIVIAGLKWENYAFKIGPDGPCSGDDVIPVELVEQEDGSKVGTFEGLLGFGKNNFVNCNRIEELENSGIEFEVSESTADAACAYDDILPASACGTYQGNDLVYSFDIEDGINDVEILLSNDGTGEPLAMFLYNYLCGGDALAFAEIRPGDGQDNFAVINTVLTSGRYFLVIDTDVFGDWGQHSGRITARPQVAQRITRSNEVCPVPEDPGDFAIDPLMANKHTFQFNVSEILYNGKAFNGGDKDPGELKVEYGFNRGRIPVYPGGKFTQDWEPGTNVSVDFFQAITTARKCGHEVDDEVLVRLALFPFNGTTANSVQGTILEFDILSSNPPEIFGTPKGSIINEFDVPPCIISFFGVTPISFEASQAEGGSKEVRIQTNKQWFVEEATVPEWIIIEQSDLGVQIGDGNLNFDIEPNNEEGASMREGRIVVFGQEFLPNEDGSEGEAIIDVTYSDTIFISQLAPVDYTPTIAFSSVTIDCDLPRGTFTLEGCADRPGVNTTWVISEFDVRAGDGDGGFQLDTFITPIDTFNTGAFLETELFRRLTLVEVTVEDEITGASFTIDTVLRVPESGPEIHCSAMQVKNCKEETVYMVDLNITGGSGDYEVEWSNGSTEFSIPELDPGVYDVTVTDLNGCTRTKKLNFQAKDECPGGLIGKDQFLCADENDPEEIVNVEFPFENDSYYDSYEWNYFWKKSTDLCSDGLRPGGAKWTVIPNAQGASYDPGPLSETTYFKRFASPKGDPLEVYPSNVVCITVNPELSVKLPRRVTTCAGDPVEFTATASGGTPPYTFTWDNGLGEGATQTASPSTLTDYTVTATDQLGCTVTAKIRVSTKPNPTISLQVADGGLEVACVSQEITLEAIVSKGTETPVWSTNGAGILNTFEGTTIVYTAAASDLMLSSLTFFATTEDGGNACDPATAEITLEVSDPSNEEFCGNVPTNFQASNDPNQLGNQIASADRIDNVNINNTGAVNETADLDQDEYGLNGIQLRQNEPNPFKNSTVIGFELDDRRKWEISIQNGIGQVVKTFSGTHNKGYHQVKFKTNDLSPGVYYYILDAGNTRLTRKMIVAEK